ncbi:hypothetical protein [Brevundimonas sp.]|uniref:COG3650 family protein n=1 Tax=Brevundimonas sp. TaxID=1871086 RepID=UPI0026101FDA|nr:hypothetical protein [Brevundimonas sp.]
MRRLYAALSLLVLAGCSPAEAPAPSPGPPAPAVVLGGVELAGPLRAIGTEPFWSVELTGTEMVYTSTEPPGQRARQPEPVVRGTTATWAAETADGTAFKVTLIATECSDGMSDRTYPLTAMVTVGDRALTGCAASAAAITSSGESGPVVE